MKKTWMISAMALLLTLSLTPLMAEETNEHQGHQPAKTEHDHGQATPAKADAGNDHGQATPAKADAGNHRDQMEKKMAKMSIQMEKMKRELAEAEERMKDGANDGQGEERGHDGRHGPCW